MPQRWDNVKSWRERAKGLRRLAESFTLPSAQDALVKSAQGYEGMADELERRLKREGVKPR
jgi:hypothetical protein